MSLLSICPLLLLKEKNYLLLTGDDQLKLGVPQPEPCICTLKHCTAARVGIKKAVSLD
jgi:hypothetical protein